nr:Ferric hydroxamate uptake [Candidatus Pantoea persica]
MKYVPKDRPITMTAALYQLTKTKNLTADPGTLNHPFSSVQSGEICSRGVELEAKAAVNANNRPDGSLYLHRCGIHRR